jgi:hypothetical protein
MVRKVEFDFLTYTSFPSSIRLTNDEGKKSVWTDYVLIRNLAITPGSTITIEAKVKQQDVAPELETYSHCGVRYKDPATGQVTWSCTAGAPAGTFDWRTIRGSRVVDQNIQTAYVFISGGPGYPDKPGITWFDDIRVYQDGKLIFSADFSNWNPYVGAGVGGVGGALAGYLITKNPLYALVGIPGALAGAAVGLYTAKP